MLLFVIIATFGISWLVRMWMMRTYKKWGAVPNAVGASGFQVARHILDTNDLQHVQLEVSKGQLSDHYIPAQDKMRLSEAINNNASVEDKEEYGMLKAKAAMMPLAAIGNQIGLALAVGGGMMGSVTMSNAGLMAMGIGVLMPVLTLPIEFDASKRALAELQRLNLVNETDYDGAKSMLLAAALKCLLWR